MILVFGGTTEGRKAAETLEESGSTYFYSTKTGEQDIVLHHGVRIDGALTAEDMQAFCREQGVRLIVDAAHPFAERLHLTIAQVSLDLQIPIVRYERIYPPRNPDITWINDYSDLDYILPSLSREGQGVGRLLATTGVQSIFKLKHLEELGIKFIYRILNRESSIVLAHQQGATDDQLCYYEDGGMPSADAILMKESGISGGFVEKVAEARAKGMRIIVIKRPEGFMKNGTWFTVNGPYGLRRIVEKLLPEFFPLHSGLTTGTCATAAAIADTIRLIKGETPAEVPVLLPDGETILVPVGYTDGYAYCIKEAGDDPDVTDGIEVRAKVEPANCFEILGGEGVGRFTLPGFDYPPGEAAINKGPREMMRQNIKENVRLTISVAGGDEIAKRTFNPRLGIEGGISIIGVSGIVKPFSEEAFIDSIRKCMTVAKASGTDSVVINSGAKSERFLKALYPNLPQQAFVQYGNYIGETLKMADELHIPNITLGVMLGKAVKLAEGQLDTHSRKSTMNIGFIQKMLNEAHIEISLENITLARELWEKIPRDQLPTFCNVVIRHCETYCKPLLPNGHLTILLISDDGTIHSR
jgi:cobalt-precorrin-5B (C1)-methyltransferase